MELLNPCPFAVLSPRDPSEKWPPLSPLGRHADPVLFKFPPYYVLSEMMFGGERMNINMFANFSK